MLANPGFPIGIEAPYSQALYTTLCKAVEKSVNFKVKIGAVMALSTPNTPTSYKTEEKNGKENVIMILSHFVLAMEGIDQAIAKSSYDDQKYVIQFLDAVKNATAHLKSLIWDSDLDPLEKELEKLEQMILEPKKSAFDAQGK
jgi:hypothetical protein